MARPISWHGPDSTKLDSVQIQRRFTRLKSWSGNDKKSRKVSRKALSWNGLDRHPVLIHKSQSWCGISSVYKTCNRLRLWLGHDIPLPKVSEIFYRQAAYL